MTSGSGLAAFPSLPLINVSVKICDSMRVTL
jgi:hypothetical protein